MSGQSDNMFAKRQGVLTGPSAAVAWSKRHFTRSWLVKIAKNMKYRKYMDGDMVYRW